MSIYNYLLMTKNEKLGYQLWLKGEDVMATISPSTIARLRKALLKFDLDIRLPFVKQIEGRSLESFFDHDNVAESSRFLINTTWLSNPE